MDQFGDKFEIKMLSLGLDGKPLFGFEISTNEPIYLLPSKWEFICFVGESGFYVCNPSTQLFVKLPEPSCCASGDLNAGIGYAEETNWYVLIHLFDRCMDLSGDCDFGCEIMRFRDGFRVSDCRWEGVNASCPFFVRGWGVLVQNMFYWIIWDVYDHPGGEAILFFDLGNEEFGTVSPPEGCFDPKGAWLLVELNGLLCLVDNEVKPSTMEIWVLKDCKKHEWVKQYSIDLTGVDDCLFKLITPLDQRDGEILIDLNRESLDFYDLENKSFKRKEDFVRGERTWLRI